MSFGTYWRMTINNYTQTDVALIRQGYPDDIRKLVYTFEEGEDGTPHIQAFIHMKRSVRFSHMKKLFPRANFGTMDSAEWRLNQHNYAQKLDETAKSPAVIQNGDPLHTVEGIVRRVAFLIMEEYEDEEDMERARARVEAALVIEDYTMAKTFVSATYKAMWKQFGGEMYMCLLKKHSEKLKQLEEEESCVNIPTHTHTHAHDENSSRGGSITSDGSEGDDAEGYVDSSQDSDGEEGEGDSDGDCSEDEGYDEGGSVDSGSSDAQSQY